MSANLESAKLFFDACETGKGWAGCNPFCHPEATFSSQTAVLSDISTLEAYCEWMKNLLIPVPDGHYELKFFAADESRNSVAAFAVFHGTQTGPGGPVPPTGKTVAADYVYHMVFEGERIMQFYTSRRVAHLEQLWGWPALPCCCGSAGAPFRGFHVSAQSHSVRWLPHPR